MNFCISCGEHVSGTRFCTVCGAEVAQAAEPTQMRAFSEDLTSLWDSGYAPVAAPGPIPPSKNRMPLIAALASVGVVVVICAVLVIPKLLKKSDDPNNAEKSPVQVETSTSIKDDPAADRSFGKESALGQQTPPVLPETKKTATNTSSTTGEGQTVILMSAPSPSPTSVPTPLVLQPATVTVVVPPTVTVTVATSHADMSKRVFAAPSGNIVCLIDSSGAVCTIDQQEWAGNGNPDTTCRFYSARINDSGASRYCGGSDGVSDLSLGLATTSWYSGGPTVEKNGVSMHAIDYGQSISLGRYSCAVERTGVTCQNVGTGRYFSTL